MIFSRPLTESLALAGLAVAVIALAVSMRGWNSQPRIVSVSVKTLIEEERDWLIERNASEESANRWIDTVATEIETSLQTLESQGYVVLVKEAVLAGDIPDLTETVRASLGVRERLTGPVSRSTDAQAAVPSAEPAGTAAQSMGDRLLAELEARE